MFGFGGVNTAPSGGFMQRMMGGLSNMRQNIPGAINALGSAMPGAAGDMSRVSGGLMKNRPGMRPNMGRPAPGGMYGGGMPGDQGPQQPQPNPQMGGMVRMPDFAYHPMFGMGGRGGNTGITGGMFGQGGPQLQMSNDNGNMPLGNSMGGGLWGAYNNLSNEQGAPTGRQMFY